MERGSGLCLLGGAALGAVTMYFFDPQSGRRRRSVCRDQFNELWHERRDAAGVIGRDLGHRAKGLAAEARHLITPDHADDLVIAERVRSAMGRSVSHPRAIEVKSQGGRVTLRGPILANEVPGLLACAAAVRGVKGVDNQLEPHQRAENHPVLQGGRQRPGPALDLMQSHLAPATRFLLGALGGGVFAWGLTKKAPTACALGTVGLAVAWPAVSGRGLGQSFGFRGWRPIHVNKTITITGPAGRVFPFFARYDNWPRFMSNLVEVRDLGNGRSHWVAKGPAGVRVSWNAILTRFEPERLIAWRSEPNSTLRNAGSIKFEPAGDGNTRVSIHLSYVPPGGRLGHIAAKLFGADPESEMNEDLVRLKRLIDQGITSAPGKGEAARQDAIPDIRRAGQAPVT
jgi:uncharacterized membrane protein